MNAKNEDHISIWSDETVANDKAAKRYYSVSICEEDGDEISCIGGSTNLVNARNVAIRENNRRIAEGKRKLEIRD